MDGLRNLAESVSRWLDGVAASIVSAFGWFLSPRIVRVVEEPDGSAFTLQMPKDAASKGERLRLADGGFAGPLPVGMLKAVRGNRVEIVLNPSRFVFKQLELPRRAVEFLDGIIRAQIDRLTPWSAADAVFGWGRPADVAGEHISIMIAATARAMVRPLLQAVSDLGAGSIAIFTVPTEGPPAARSMQAACGEPCRSCCWLRWRRRRLRSAPTSGSAANSTRGSSMPRSASRRGVRFCAATRARPRAAPPLSSIGASRRRPRP
jgi:general secretion pathway protein L